ncbi:flagellar associated [Micractinium conductrix]|uniref:Flagellar associated n=1 Tax=Micractinium conductrix TaxID=554055 RepID=A0A2P6VPH7_9CHLO|nr:flagellar associated [Micractinium conductrix]|eukprot:PSC76002.1 flagellar associated [Micractinium conductrix]
MSGVRIKTRKRNIVVPHDPQSFADALIDIIEDAREEGVEQNVAKILESANKVLDAAELDFSRYGDVLFEVAFAGARLTTGGNVATEGKKLNFNILAGPADREEILFYIKWFQAMIRRRPFLVKNLENVLMKFVMGMEFYDDDGRRKIAIALARCFSMKVGILPESILPRMLVDRLVARGAVLQFVTEFFKEFLATDTVEHLIEVLRKARMDQNLLEFFPQQKRTWPEFESHFEAAGLTDFVAYNRKKLYEVHCQELGDTVQGMVAEDPPPAATAVVAEVNARKAEWGLEDGDVAKAMFGGLVQSVMANIGSKNTQQVQFSVLKTLKTYAKALGSFATTARLEAVLLNYIQVSCYEDSRLLKLFPDIVKILYDTDVLGEDTIRFWYTKGSSPKGRNVFLKNMEPFMKWLDEAEEDESDDE